LPSLEIGTSNVIYTKKKPGIRNKNVVAEINPYTNALSLNSDSEPRLSLLLISTPENKLGKLKGLKMSKPVGSELRGVCNISPLDILSCSSTLHRDQTSKNAIMSRDHPLYSTTPLPIKKAGTPTTVP
jgi:hypothetical protein